MANTAMKTKKVNEVVSKPNPNGKQVKQEKVLVTVPDIPDIPDIADFPKVGRVPLQETIPTIKVTQVISLEKIRARASLREFARIFTDGKGKEAIPLQELLVDEGNLKIPATTAIFNMSSATDCASLKLGLCQAVVDGKNYCYAKKAEYSYRPHVLPFRRRQALYWKTVTAEQFASQFMMINSLKEKPFNALRFNEAGDFQVQDHVDKAEQIARYLKKDGITTYCYTARSDLDYSGCRDLIVNGSGFIVNGNEFRFIVKIEDKPKGYGVCHNDCRVCDRCLHKGNKTVVVKH